VHHTNDAGQGPPPSGDFPPSRPYIGCPGAYQGRERELSHAGELAALGTALCWTVTVTAFEAAARRIGSIPVNVIRLFQGLLMLSAFTLLTRGNPLPLDAPGRVWLWLSLSGMVGFVLGDVFLFRAFVLIGSRMTMLVYALVPPMTAVLGLRDWAGMAVTIAGISMVILTRGERGRRGIRLSQPLTGILFAFLGAVGQASGLVLSKYGVGSYDAFGATQIRILAAFVLFCTAFVSRGFRRRIAAGLGDRRALTVIALGAFFGPFIGVSLSLVAIKHVETGIASTIMALVPVFLIVPAVALYRQRIRPREVMGALVAVAGVALLTL
jgi:drug/metabolite transporter (DMT)-like permease